eukprot:5004348-Alexandrium_andersonii.AAC.1
MTKRFIGTLIEPLFAEVQNDGAPAKIAVLLPHELFSELWTCYPELAASVLIGKPADLRDYWAMAASTHEDWLEGHPLRNSALARPLLTIPVRLWGDDAPVGEQHRACRTMCWASCT